MSDRIYFGVCIDGPMMGKAYQSQTNVFEVDVPPEVPARPTAKSGAVACNEVVSTFTYKNHVIGNLRVWTTDLNATDFDVLTKLVDNTVDLAQLKELENE